MKSGYKLVPETSYIQNTAQSYMEQIQLSLIKHCINVKNAYFSNWRAKNLEETRQGQREIQILLWQERIKCNPLTGSFVCFWFFFFKPLWDYLKVIKDFKWEELRNSIAQEKSRAWPPNYCLQLHIEVWGISSTTCSGPQVIQTWEWKDKAGPTVKLQIHKPATSHLMQYPAPSISDWRCLSDVKKQTVNHTGRLFCIGANKFHIAYINFTWLLGPRPTW